VNQFIDCKIARNNVDAAPWDATNHGFKNPTSHW